ncbi:hypothetical protein POTOM_059940 [Populus tomentosa]|uniref:Tetratricopeptide SHNi-TPR domain-containing protein n=1 Tax=Populus tomentosa TaxID=118781 RepID=A0A8X8BZ98_POPTO|nr:hypothetical protein POTOM_059940 [Populus tomentosa]
MASESSVTEPKTAPIENQTSVEATIKGSTTTTSSQGGAADSTCNDDNNGETSDPRKSLDFAVELSEKGTNALKENDFSEAVECFSRALEIRVFVRVLHHGELALECVNAYYLYGRALLYKAQEEADPVAMVPQKDSESKQDDNKDGASRNFVNGEFSSASVSSNVEEGGGSNHPEGAAGGDVARAIAEKHLDDTMDKVDILSALAEVALEREDIETSLSDYQKALSILERLVEPDSRHLAELYPYQALTVQFRNFRICLCLEIGSQPQEAIPYCQKAISVCKARLQRLIKEQKSSTESATSSAVSELDEGVQQSSNVLADKSVTDKEAEIETLSGLSAELEKKLEDLQQLVLNPESILAEILGMVSDKAKGGVKSASPNLTSSSQLVVANSGGSFDSPTISSSHTNGVLGVTDLGVAGRGVKRVLTSTDSVGSSSAVKKPTPDPSSDKGDGKTC